MARSRNDFEFSQRKRQIINAAIGLIMKEGYDSFSLNKFLVQLNIPKGTFFHYFKSKQTLIDDAVQISAQSITFNYRSIEKSISLNPKDKLKKIYRDSSVQNFFYGTEGKGIAQLFYSKANKKFIDLVAKYCVKDFRKLLTNVVSEGIESNHFAVTDLDGTIEHIVNLTLGTNERISAYFLSGRNDRDLDSMMEVISTFERILNFLLGTEDLVGLYELKI